MTASVEVSGLAAILVIPAEADFRRAHGFYFWFRLVRVGLMALGLRQDDETLVLRAQRSHLYQIVLSLGSFQRWH